MNKKLQPETETEYLLGTEANKERLLKSIKSIDEGKVFARDLVETDYEISIDESVDKEVKNILKG